jgi:hypothetical protein
MSLSDPKTPDTDYEKQIPPLDSKEAFKQAEADSVQDTDSDIAVLSTERDIATHVVSIQDDPTLNPWTIRAFIIGLGLSAFGGVLGKSLLLFLSFSGVESFEQPRFITSNQYGLAFLLGCLLILINCQQQTVLVSTLFLAIISYVLGMTMAAAIPQTGFFRYLNPVSFRSLGLERYELKLTLFHQHPFNKKENAFIIIMASAAANSALGTEVLAVQRLFYNITPNAGASIL